MSSYSSLATVERTFQVIEVLIGQKNGLSVTDIVHKTNLDKSTVSRILITLKQAGYVEVDKNTRFNKLSFKFLSLTYKHINALGVEQIFYPFLEKLAIRSGELVQLATLTDNGLYFVGKVEGNRTLKVASMLGERAPYHATAAGKLVLASLSTSEMIQLIGGKKLKKYTDNTITDIEDLIQEIIKVREQGYSIANEEINPDIKAVGLPIYEESEPKRLLASVVFAAPNFRMDEKRIEELVGIFKDELNNFDVSLLKSFNLGLTKK